MKVDTKSLVSQAKAAMDCLTGDLRAVMHSQSFTVVAGKDTFTVTVERTSP